MNGRSRLAVLAALIVLAATASACEDARPVAPRLAGGTWTQMPDAPLSPRHSAGVWDVAGRVIVVGGTTSPPCPPSASCVPTKVVPFRDGASFETATSTWKRIADAPVPLEWMSGAVVGKVLYLWVPKHDSVDLPRAFLAYHADTDRWERLRPPSVDDGLRLVAAGERVIAYNTTQENGVRPDLVFDPRKRVWEELPADPLVASFDRAMVWTGRDLVLLGLENVPQPNSERPSLYRAAAFDLPSNRWRRLADSQVLGYGPDWFFAAGVIVNAWVGGADGGEANGWGRSYPYGGIFDPSGNAWTSLPRAPEGGTYRGPTVGGPRFVVAGGRVFDALARKWTILTAPSGTVEGQGAAWAGDRLILWGGSRGYLDRAVFVNEGWIWEQTG